MSAPQWLDGETCSRVALVLWQVTWSGTVLAMLGAAAARWATQRASSRYWIHSGTLAAMLALVPLWSIAAGLTPSSVRATSPSPIPAPTTRDSTNTPLPAQQLPIAPAATEVDPEPRSAPGQAPGIARLDRTTSHDSPASDWIVRGVTIGYAAGLLAMLLRLVIGVWGGERLRSAGRPVEEPGLLDLMSRQARRLGLRMVPMLRTCERVAAPVVVGLLRPVVLVPTSMLTGLTLDQLSVVLTHELAHLRRHDHILLLGQRIAEAVLFFHPAVWYLSRQIDQTREEACDDLVLAQGSDALEYARSLLRVAELRLGPAAQLSALSVEGASPSLLRRRIARLLGMGDAPAMRLTRTGVVTLLFGLIGAVSLTFALAGDGPSDSPIAHFPDGVEVELLGLAPFPSEGQTWWKPDGSPLAAGPAEKFGGQFYGMTPEQQAQCREIWAVVRGATSAVQSHVIVEGETRGSIGNMQFEPPTQLYTLRRAGGPIPDRDKTKIQIGLSLTDSLPLRTFDLDGNKTIPGASTEAIQTLDDIIQFQSFSETADGIELLVRKLDEIRDKASIELLAIDEDGREVRSTASSGRESANGFTFKLPRDKLSKFAYRLRPYTHWVTFDDVSLQPNSNTKLKVASRIDSSVYVSSRLEFRIVSQAPGGPRGPLAPNDWASQDYRILTGKPAGPKMSPGFVWAPVRNKNERQSEQFKLDLALEKTGEGGPFYLLSDAPSETLLDDGSWRIVSATTSQGQFGREVLVELDDAGGEKLSALTGNHLDCRLAIVMDGRIVMAPTIRSQIGGKFVITGNFTKAECDDLVELLNLPMAKRTTEGPAGYVKGQVVTPEGLGIENAEVVVTPNGRDSQPVTILSTATTDATGTFQIPISAKLLESRQMVGVWARAEGYVAQRDNSVTFIKHLVTDKSRIKLFPATETTVALLDKDRKPVEGATIRLSHVQVEEGVAYKFPEPWLKEYGGTTDAEGKVTVRNISPETVRQFDLELPGGARLRFDQDYFLNTKPLAQAPHFTIPAPEVGQVEGVLEWKRPPAEPKPGDDAGAIPALSNEEFAAMLTRPKSGGEPIQVNLLTEVRKPPFGTWAGIYGFATISLTEPQFHAVLPAGPLSVTTTMTAHQPLQPQIPERLEVKANETTPVLIPVQQGVKVRGQIRKGDTKEGIPEFGLRLIYGPSAHDVNDQKHSVELKTDATGTYTAYVPPGPVRIRENNYYQNYISIESWNDGPWNHRDKPLLVPAGVNEFDLPPLDLDRSKTVRGKVVDQTGKPLVDWMVFGFPGHWEEQYNGQKEPKSFVMNSFAGVSTDEKGEFEGTAPVSYPPERWRLSHRTWPTKFDFEDRTYVPKIRSRDPLVLEVDLIAGPVPEDDEEAEDRDNEVIEPAKPKVDDDRPAAELLPNRVIDAQGQPVAGATVEFQKNFKYAWIETPPPIAQLTTDAEARVISPQKPTRLNALDFSGRLRHPIREVRRERRAAEAEELAGGFHDRLHAGAIRNRLVERLGP
jgi:beta-lactamase regulating signal transducer with metallopeptidase domain